MATRNGIGENVDNKRMRQLIVMFSNITGKTEEESKRIILETETGQAVYSGNPIVLYEQQTENINSIAIELKNSKYTLLGRLFTKEAIVKSMQELKKMCEREWENHIIIESEKELKEVSKEQLQVAQKMLLRHRRQNKKNAKMIERVDKILDKKRTISSINIEKQTVKYSGRDRHADNIKE